MAVADRVPSPGVIDQPVYIDDALGDHPEIWAAAGHPHTVMPLTFESLRILTDGEVIAVA